MKNYIIVNRVTNVIVWKGSDEDYKKTVWYNPMLANEEALKMIQASFGNELYVRA